MTNWKLVKLEEIATFQEGYVNPPQTNNDYFDGDVKWLRAVDLNDSEVWNTSRTLSDVGFESAGKSALMFKPNTIAISKSGTIGRLGILKDYMCGNRAVINIEVNEEKADLMYVFYSLIMARREIIQYAVGSVQANLYPSVLGKLEIPLPPLPTQKKIASVISAIDNMKINNQDTSSRNNEIVATLFRSWFIDFDPVKAKAEGKLPYGMDAETAALFPDTFEDSEIGPIPSGWKLYSILELGDFLNGVASQKYPVTSEDDSLPVVKIREMQNGVTEKSDWASNSTPQKYHINEGDILFSWAATLLVQHWQGNKAILNQHIFKVTPSKNFPEWFVYQYLTSELWKFQRMATAGETMMGHIKRKDLQQHLIVIPANQLLKKLSETMNPLYSLSKSISINQKHITSIRDALLPKLMSGELSVS